MAPSQFAFEVRSQRGRGNAGFFEQTGDKTVRLANQRQQQVFPINFLVEISLSDALRFLQCFLRFDCKPIHLHKLVVPMNPSLKNKQKDAKCKIEYFTDLWTPRGVSTITPEAT